MQAKYDEMVAKERELAQKSDGEQIQEILQGEGLAGVWRARARASWSGSGSGGGCVCVWMCVCICVGVCRQTVRERDFHF